jgi:hypothetical protein
MAGVGGTVSGLVSGAAGSVATSWGWVSSGGTLTSGTIIASLVARADVFGQNQRLTLAAASGTGTTNMVLQQEVTVNSLAAGDVLEGCFDLTVASGSAGIEAVQLMVREYNPAGDFYYNSMVPIASHLLGATGYAGPLRSPRWTARAGTTAVALKCQIVAELATAGGCNLVADVGLACLRKVA